jgi:hypothetical protein
MMLTCWQICKSLAVQLLALKYGRVVFYSISAIGGDVNSRQIFEDVLLLDKSITLSFPSTASLNSFKATLQKYKSRYNSRLKSLGMDQEDILEGKSIVAEILEREPRILVHFSLGTRKVPKQYTIVEITEQHNESQISADLGST